MTAPRKYESPLRRRQAAETRERIVAAGSELAHEFPRWDWRELTVAAVAGRAGVHVRTVYRYFASERELHDAVMHRLEEEAGVSLTSLHLEDYADLTARTIRYLSSFAAGPSKASADPVFEDIDQRRRAALLAAVEPRTADWPEQDRLLAAALLDICWSLPSYERLASAWDLDVDGVTRAVTWFVHLLEQAIRDGRRPPPAHTETHPPA